MTSVVAMRDSLLLTFTVAALIVHSFLNSARPAKPIDPTAVHYAVYIRTFTSGLISVGIAPTPDPITLHPSFNKCPGHAFKVTRSVSVKF